MALALFIDDDQNTLQLMQIAAGILGHQAVVCRSPVDGLEKARTLDPDVIFVDQRMPEMSGLDFISGFRRQDPRPTRVYLVSADAAIGNDLLVKCGATGAISKPLGIATLERLLAPGV